MNKKYSYLPLTILIFFFSWSNCSDITNLAFGSQNNGEPAAFGDFNSDELTDLFIIRDYSSVEILLGSTKEPLFTSDPRLKCTFPGYRVSSVVPGDFDGDASMDMLVVARNRTRHSPDFINSVFIAWGNTTSLKCPDKPSFEMHDEPLAIDYSNNMKADLFGANVNRSRVLWLFHNRTLPPQELPLPASSTSKLDELRVPHSHAFLDLNHDNWPDLYVTTEKGFEIWLWDDAQKNFFLNSKSVPNPVYKEGCTIGQTLFMDLETADRMNQIVPVLCEKGDKESTNSTIYVRAFDRWFDLNVNFVHNQNEIWKFAINSEHQPDTITLRAGDFNNDGYVDMLASLALVSDPTVKRVFLLENVPCVSNCPTVKRTFEIQWSALGSSSENSVVGAFYDFMQDGILDIIFLHNKNDKYTISAFKNDLDYDANFIKVMVITGLTNNEIELPPTLLGTKRRTFGTNLPGPKIRYKTTTQDGTSQTGLSVQLPQSAHCALHLPYTIFGLGRTPNFIEDLTIGVFNKSRTWNQIIPNSQLVVIPYPQNDPSAWRAQLFVTPSKIVLQTVVALAGTCVVIGCIIGMLHWKERREDRIERLQEAHRFHFDAM